jgi:hypothetical protein
MPIFLMCFPCSSRKLLMVLTKLFV